MDEKLVQSSSVSVYPLATVQMLTAIWKLRNWHGRIHIRLYRLVCGVELLSGGGECYWMSMPPALHTKYRPPKVGGREKNLSTPPQLYYKLSSFVRLSYNSINQTQNLWCSHRMQSTSVILDIMHDFRKVYISTLQMQLMLGITRWFENLYHQRGQGI